MRMNPETPSTLMAWTYDAHEPRNAVDSHGLDMMRMNPETPSTLMAWTHDAHEARNAVDSHGLDT